MDRARPHRPVFPVIVCACCVVNVLVVLACGSALLPDGPAPKARPTYRRDALCFALGCATAAMVLVAFDLPSALSSDSARAPAALSADEKMKAGTASQIAALKAQISEKDNALSLSLMELDRVRAVAATGDAGSSGCWEWVCPTPAPSPYPSGGETSRRRRCHPGRRGLESRVSHVARIFCSPSPTRRAIAQADQEPEHVPDHAAVRAPHGRAHDRADRAGSHSVPDQASHDGPRRPDRQSHLLPDARDAAADRASHGL